MMRRRSDVRPASGGAANDCFWAKLGAAADRVYLWGTSGGTNTKRVIAPLDYLLATYGTWIDL